MPSLPLEEVTQLMQFIAVKTKNVTSPMNVIELCRQFKEETGSSVLLETLCTRIQWYRLRIHELEEFDMETKVKMMFALSTPIDAGFLIEMKKVAEVEVDDLQRIIQYKQKDGGLELSGKYMRMWINQARPNSIPPEEISQMMRFIAEKSKNVTSPMNVAELCRQFQSETGSLVSVKGLTHRINSYRDRIHRMNEFDMETKVKMLFALGTPIDAGFLIELKKVAEVEVDNQQRIISYKQMDGRLELTGKYLRISIDQGERRDRDIFQFLAKKSKATDKPIANRAFMREFKEKNRYTDSISALDHRYRHVKNTIYQSSEIDKNTKIKMMFISNVKLSDEILKELREDADVEIDEEGRITKYKSKDGSLDLGGSHEMSFITRSYYSNRWRTVCDKVNEEKDGEDDANWQNDYQRNRIDLIRFLIERTKHATFPLNLNQLAKDYGTEFRCLESHTSIHQRIRSFRRRIREMNQLDNPTKVKLAFALSAAIDADFLTELQKDSIVELDDNQKIKKYEANDGSLELEGDHSHSAKTRAAIKNAKWTRIVSDSNESTGEKYFQSTSLSQSPAAIQRGRKRARIAYSSSEVSEGGDDNEEWKMMDYDTNKADDGRYDYFYHDPPYYEEDMEHIQVEKKPESLLEVKTEKPSTSIVRNHYEDNFLDYDPSTFEKNLEHFSEEKKPENFTEVKLEVPEESSTNNLEYHNEDILTEPKPEIVG